MAGCGGGTCGINSVREREREGALVAIASAYPDGGWTETPRLPQDSPWQPAELVEIAKRIEELLPCRVSAKPRETVLGSSLWILCGIHEPSILEWAGGSGRGPRPMRPIETYLRVAFSELGRYATLQEVQIEWSRLGDSEFVSRTPHPGVEDPDLKHFVKGLQGFLRNQRVVQLDFAFLIAPTWPIDSPEYDRQYGTPSPTRWSCLFDPAPPTTRTEEIVALAAPSLAPGSPRPPALGLGA